MLRSRLVELDPEVRRDGASNAGTVLRPWQWSAWRPGLRDQFLAAYHDLRAAARRFARRGVLVGAVHGLALRASVALASWPDRLATTIVGRHGRSELFLPDDEEVSLRHLAILVHRGGPADPVRCTVLDLRSERGFEDEHGAAREAISTSGPCLLRCASYALFLLPCGEGALWPASAEAAWEQLPPRSYEDGALGVVREERPALEPTSTDGAREQTVVSCSAGPRRLRQRLVRPGAEPLGELLVSTPRRTIAIEADSAALREGLLLGRYPRCEAGGVELGLGRDVSRVHALVLEVDGELCLIDTASRCGVRVGGEERRVVRLAPGVRATLASEATVEWRPLS